MNRLSEVIARTITEFELPDDGQWITSRGRRIFIGGEPRSARPKPPPGKTAGKRVTYKKKDGSTGTTVEFPTAWSKASSAAKFSRVAAIAKNAEHMERSFRLELAGDDPTPKKATATAMLLMMKTGMRVGGGDAPGKPGMTKGDETFGTTTLRKKHVTIKGDTVSIKFKGKAGVDHDITVRDKDLAESIKVFMGGKNSDPADDPLFQTRDAKGNKRILSRNHVAKRMKKFDPDYKNHDLRTHHAATVASEKALSLIEADHKKRLLAHLDGKPPKQATRAALLKLSKAVRKEIANAVGNAIGDTPSVALSAYTHPGLVEHVLRELGLPEIPPPPPKKKKAAKTEADQRDLWDLLDVVNKGRDEDIEKQFPILVGLHGTEAVKNWLGSYGADEEDPSDEEAEGCIDALDDNVED